MEMNNKVDKIYQDLLKDILENGFNKGDRTGTGTKSVFGRQMRFNLNNGFPLLTTKRVYWKGVVHELLWMLGAMPEEYNEYGNTNIKYLVDNNVNIWVGDAYKAFKNKRTTEEIKILGYPTTEEDFIKRIKEDKIFAKTYGDLGPIYGKQWTSWVSESKVMHQFDGSLEIIQPVKAINQIADLIQTLKINPDSRRIMVNAWNVSDLDDMVLPPCHYGFQVWTRELSFQERYKIWHDDNKEPNVSPYLQEQLKDKLDMENIPKRAISLQMTQRSCDTFLGVPFNIASYALLLHMIAQCVNMIPEEFIWLGGDVHIYNNHINQCLEQINREGRELPKLNLNPDIKDIFKFRFNDIKIEGYNPHPPIKGDLSN